MKSFVMPGGRFRATALALTSVLVSGIVLLTAGCGPEKQTTSAPAALNNTPPGGASVDEYNRMMMQKSGKSNSGSGFPSGGPGGAPGGAPGGPGGAAPVAR